MQDRDSLFVRPVVQDELQETQVADGHGSEEVPPLSFMAARVHAIVLAGRKGLPQRGIREAAATVTAEDARKRAERTERS